MSKKDYKEGGFERRGGLSSSLLKSYRREEENVVKIEWKGEAEMSKDQLDSVKSLLKQEELLVCLFQEKPVPFDGWERIYWEN